MKMKKIVALVTASALCLGMSMTVFAENSLTDDDVAEVNPSISSDSVKGVTSQPIVLYPSDDKVGRIEAGSLTSKEGKFNTINEIYSKEYAKFVKENVGKGLTYEREDQIPASKIAKLKEDAAAEYTAVIETFGNASQLKTAVEAELQKEGYTLTDDSAPTVVCAANLTLMKPTFDGDGNWKGYEPITDPDDPALKAGIKQSFRLGELKDIEGMEENDVIRVLHRTDNGWELLEATVQIVNGVVYAEATFTSLSPVAFVRMSNGDIVKVDPATREPEKDENGNNVVVNKPNTNGNANANGNAKTNGNANVKKATTVSTGKSPKTGEF